MDIFNQIVTTIFNILFFPLQTLGRFWGLFLVAVLTGLLMLIILKKVSNQEGIHATKNRIKAHVLGARLYQHDASLSVRILGRLFLENGRYLLYALKPMLILMIPVTILIIQLSARYGYQPASLGKPILVRLVANDVDDLSTIRIIPSTDVRIDVTPLTIPALHEINWRIYPITAGVSTLIFQYKETQEEKKMVTDGRWSVLSPRRLTASVRGFLYAAEPTLSSNSFAREISIEYDETKLSVAGVNIHWLVFFILVSLMTGVAAQRLFKVEI